MREKGYNNNLSAYLAELVRRDGETHPPEFATGSFPMPPESTLLVNYVPPAKEG